MTKGKKKVREGERKERKVVESNDEKRKEERKPWRKKRRKEEREQERTDGWMKRRGDEKKKLG